MQSKWPRTLRFESLECRYLLSATTLPGTVSGYAVSLDRHDAPGEDIDPAAETWIVIHGNASAPTTDYIDELATALHAASSGDQILTLDWSETAALFIGATENQIIPVAEWASSTLTSYGFAGSLLNLAGHSFGAYVAAEMAERIEDGVDTIVGLDPAQDWPFGYNPEASGQVDFSSHSAYSWTFSEAGGLLGSETTPGSADEAIVIENTTHSDVVRLFNNMLNGIGDADVLQYFELSRLESLAPGPWLPDQFNDAGGPSITGQYEAVITASNGVTPIAIDFFPETTPPYVAEIKLGSDSWSHDFKDFIDAETVGSGSGLGYQVPEAGPGDAAPANDQLDNLPWTNLNKIYVAFSENVSQSWTADHVHLTGTNVTDYKVSPGITLEPFGTDGENIGTITLQDGVFFAADTILFTLSDALMDLAGNALDGEWTTNGSTQSGDGTAGGAFHFRFDVLPGDVNNDGFVTAADTTIVQGAQFSNVATGPPYTGTLDIEGDGFVTTADVTLVQIRQFTFVPFTPPPTPTSPASLVSSESDRRFESSAVDDLFAAIEESPLAPFWEAR